MTLVAVGLGDPVQARQFCEVHGLPTDMLYSDPSGAAYSALGFRCAQSCMICPAEIGAMCLSSRCDTASDSLVARRLCSPGFAPDANVSAYLKLLPMLAGIGSPGTLQEVRRPVLQIHSAVSCGGRHCGCNLLTLASAE